MEQFLGIILGNKRKSKNNTQVDLYKENELCIKKRKYMHVFQKGHWKEIDGVEREWRRECIFSLSCNVLLDFFYNHTIVMNYLHTKVAEKQSKTTIYH